MGVLIVLYFVDWNNKKIFEKVVSWKKVTKQRNKFVNSCWKHKTKSAIKNSSNINLPKKIFCMCKSVCMWVFYSIYFVINVSVSFYGLFKKIYIFLETIKFYIYYVNFFTPATQQDDSQPSNRTQTQIESNQARSSRVHRKCSPLH